MQARVRRENFEHPREEGALIQDSNLEIEMAEAEAVVLVVSAMSVGREKEAMSVGREKDILRKIQKNIPNQKED